MAVSKNKRAFVYERDGFRCLKCGQDDVRYLTIDHIFPKAYGGKNNVDNLQTLCQHCNSKKGMFDFSDYRLIKLDQRKQKEHNKKIDETRTKDN